MHSPVEVVDLDDDAALLVEDRTDAALGLAGDDAPSVELASHVEGGEERDGALYGHNRSLVLDPYPNQVTRKDPMPTIPTPARIGTRPAAHESHAEFMSRFADLLSTLHPFRTSGALHAERYPSHTGTGLHRVSMFNRFPLTDRFADPLRFKPPHVDFVVFSYAAPIAWHTADDGDDVGGEWFVTGRRFSVTTSRHTQLMRRVLATAAIPYADSPSIT